MEQSAAPDNLGRQLFDVFKSGDFEKFKLLLFNSADYKEVLTDPFRSSPGTESQEVQRKVALFDRSAASEYRKLYNRLIRKGEKTGIDWTSIEFGKFVYKEDKPVNSSKKFVSGHLNFTAHGVSYTLFGIEAMQFAGGYKISGIRSVLKGSVGEHVDPDLLEED